VNGLVRFRLLGAEP